MTREPKENSDTVHPTIGNHSWALPIRVLQLIFAILVLSLASYTLSRFPGWREARFTVATVRPNSIKLIIGGLGFSLGPMDFDVRDVISS